MKAIVFIILQIFFTTRADLKIGESLGCSPVFTGTSIQARDVFRPVAREWKYLMDYKYILLDVLVGSIAVYFYELCRILTSP